MDKKQAIDLIRESSLSGVADILIECLLPSARLDVREHPGRDIEDSVTSHFGGLPSMPRGVAWPVWDRHDFLISQIARFENRFRENPRATGLRDIASRMRQDLFSGPLPLAFLGQLSLDEIQATVALPGWPRNGMLCFFYDLKAGGFDPETRGAFRVFFFPANEQLALLHAPEDLPAHARFPLRKLDLRCEWTLPTRISQNGVDLSIWGHEDYSDLCSQLMPNLGKHTAIHRCGGHPQEIQSDMRLECQLVTNGIYCGEPSGYQDPRRTMLEKGAADWSLLLQVDSDEQRVGWMWGDAGRVYFWARQQDIEAASFDGSWGILQCY